MTRSPVPNARTHPWAQLHGPRQLVIPCHFSSSSPGSSASDSLRFHLPLLSQSCGPYLTERLGLSDCCLQFLHSSRGGGEIQHRQRVLASASRLSSRPHRPTGPPNWTLCGLERVTDDQAVLEVLALHTISIPVPSVTAACAVVGGTLGTVPLFCFRTRMRSGPIGAAGADELFPRCG